MKKFKVIAASLLFCAMSYVGYTTYEEMSMTEAEKLMQANVEALTSGEGGSSTSWPCWSNESSGNGYWRCGNPCTWVDGAGGKGTQSKCYKN